MASVVKTPRALATELIGRALALADAPMRAAWLGAELTRLDVAEVAGALDVWCLDAEQAVESAREAMHALVHVVNAPAHESLATKLREEAAGRTLVGLARLLRRSLREVQEIEIEPRVPDYGTGRPLTLGERKALARKPNRQYFDRLLADPHPDVIRNLLTNPKLTEEDVVRLASRRPPRAEILAEIARSVRWLARSHVRMAIVLNPGTPPELAVPIVTLLVRHELRLVIEVTDANPSVRAAARELYLRRPPSLGRARPKDGIG
jgi:hypothetical protein